MSDVLLKVDICKNVKRFSLSSTFEAGSGIYGILGASGCGKSMTLKSIAGIETPDRGRISVFNAGQETVLFDKEKRINCRPQKRNVGYLFQNYALFPNMTVEQNIMAGMGNVEKTNAAGTCESLIRSFHLEGLEKRYPATLSGGQQQRVALARIMAYNPEILLLDEPFSAMDAFLREGLRLELAQLLRDFEGVSIMVSHDRDEIYQLCDQIILMDEGSIIQMGEKNEIFHNPATVIAARLTGCKNISRIARLDSRKIAALDWDNTILHTEVDVAQDITHVGIRAHDLQPVAESISMNTFSTAGAKVSEMPFEWYVTFANNLWWKREKGTMQGELSIPKQLYVSPDKLLLLK